MLDSVISVVSGGAARANFGSAKLMLVEHICMLTERSKFINRNVLSTYAAPGKQSGRGDCGRGGRNGTGGGSRGHGDNYGMLNGEWYKRCIASGDN